MGMHVVAPLPIKNVTEPQAYLLACAEPPATRTGAPRLGEGGIEARRGLARGVRGAAAAASVASADVAGLLGLLVGPHPDEALLKVTVQILSLHSPRAFSPDSAAPTALLSPGVGSQGGTRASPAI